MPRGAGGGGRAASAPFAPFARVLAAAAGYVVLVRVPSLSSEAPSSTLNRLHSVMPLTNIALSVCNGVLPQLTSFLVKF